VFPLWAVFTADGTMIGTQHTDRHRKLIQYTDEWTIAKYMMEVMRRFRYWTLGMSKRNMVTLLYIIAVYIDRFHHIDGIMRAVAKKKTQRKEDLYITVKLA
jgi:hypothetical protein